MTNLPPSHGSGSDNSGSARNSSGASRSTGDSPRPVRSYQPAGNHRPTPKSTINKVASPPIVRRDFLTGSAAVVAAGALGALGGRRAEAEDPKANADAAETDFRNVTYAVRPIGRIRNRKGKPVQLEIFEKYVPGLLRLEHCKRVMVVWWFHKNDTPEKRSILKVHPQGNPDNPLTGVFATHSPVRPNLIALTVCNVLSVKGGLVTIDSIDAFDDAPIIDLKSS